MKKSIKIILIIIGIITLMFGFDIASILLRNKPIFAFSDNNDSVNKVYRGLFYDTYNCQEYPMAQIKARGSKFSCAIFNQSDYIIIDTSKDIKDFICAEALEEIYRDDTYIYYLPCIKSKYIKVQFQNTNQMNVIEALKNNKISINDLDNYNIKYYKYLIETQ